MRQSSLTAVALCAVLLLCGRPGYSQSLTASRLLGGSGSDAPTAIATDSSGNIYVAGITTSPDFPVTHALYSKPQEPALRIGADGSSFAASSLHAVSTYAVGAAADGSVVLAATEKGIYRSLDQGATWTAAASSPTATAYALAFDPSDSAKAFAVTRAIPTGGYELWAVATSSDGGANWQTRQSFTVSPVSTVAARIIVNPQHPAQLYAFIANLLYASTDAGATWQPVTIPAASAPDGQASISGFALAPSQPNLAYATTYYTPLMKTSDGGLTWQSGADLQSAGPNAISVDPANPSVVWLVNGAGVQRSTDGGASFQRMTATGAGSWRYLTVSPANSSLIFASNLNNVYRSADGGNTWWTVASGTILGVFATQTQVYVAASQSATVFLAKFDSALSQTVFSTYLGPASSVHMALDGDGNVYLTGQTASLDYPVTANAIQKDFAQSIAGFVTKVRSDGAALVYSTFLDGLQPFAIGVDANGNAVVAGGTSNPLPVTSRAFEATAPSGCSRTGFYFNSQLSETDRAFALKLTSDGGSLVYATYLGGSCGDQVNAVAVDSDGVAWLAGITYSPDFPVTSDAMIAAFPATESSAFLSALSADGSQLRYATFLGGGAQNSASAISLDGRGGVLVAGYTQAKPTSGAYRSTPKTGCPPVISIGPSLDSSYQQDDGFVMKLTPPSASPVFLATIGGGCQDSVSSMALDAAGNIWLSGSTSSLDFPIQAPIGALGVSTQGSFLAELDSTASTLLFSSFMAANGQLALSAGGGVDFAESLTPAGKTSGTSAFAGRVDGSLHPAIVVNAVQPLGTQAGLSSSTFVPPLVAPGQIMILSGSGLGPATAVSAQLTAQGTFPTALGGVQVTFNGFPAPLVSAQENRIECMAPFELDGDSAATVVVSYASQASNEFPLVVQSQNFSLLAVTNSDGSANSATNSARVGSIVSLYISGAGQTVPPSVDGALNASSTIVPRAAPTATIALNGAVTQPVFYGAAVGEVASLMQMNVWMPTPSYGSTVPISFGSVFVQVYVAQ